MLMFLTPLLTLAAGYVNLIPGIKIVKSVLGAIPPKVWLGIAVALAVLYYGHWSRVQGRDEVKAQVAVALKVEVDRQQKATTVVLANAKARYEKAEAERSALQRKVDDVTQHAQTDKDAGNACLDAAAVKRLRKL